jgi:hypothetical protein
MFNQIIHAFILAKKELKSSSESWLS